MRPKYFVDGEPRPPLRGAQAKYLRENLMVPILLTYFVLCMYQFPITFNFQNVFIYFFLRVCIIISFYGSIVYSDWLHNLDKLHDGALNTPSIELSVLRWDMWFVSMIMFFKSTYIVLSCPSSELLDTVIYDDFGPEFTTRECLVGSSFLCSIFIAIALSNVKLKPTVKEPIEIHGSILLLHEGKAFHVAKLFLALQFFNFYTTCYLTNNWLNSWYGCSFQLFGFACFIFKSKKSLDKDAKSIDYWRPTFIRPIIQCLNIEDAGAHEIFHIFTHGTWLFFMLTDLMEIYNLFETTYYAVPNQFMSLLPLVLLPLVVPHVLPPLPPPHLPPNVPDRM
jgi:hypothetical protein